MSYLKEAQKALHEILMKFNENESEDTPEYATILGAYKRLFRDEAHINKYCETIREGKRVLREIDSIIREQLV